VDTVKIDEQLLIPAGRHTLSPDEVGQRQRERLLRAIVGCASERGYADTTIADVVKVARTSRSAFYEHFADKEGCFLAATREGGELLLARVATAARQLPAGASAEDVLRASLAAFLDFLAGEPAFTRAFYVDMPAAGPRAVRRLAAAQHKFAGLNQAWHERARREHPSWPEVPYEAYYALAGATAELVRAEVRHGTIDAVRDLEDTLVDLHLAVLAARPWGRPG
jgi:AcrR family transcriptional regulator